MFFVPTFEYAAGRTEAIILPAEKAVQTFSDIPEERSDNIKRWRN